MHRMDVCVMRRYLGFVTVHYINGCIGEVRLREWAMFSLSV